MNKKYDINYVEREFSKDGYRLLTSKYINTRQKLDYICSKGHKHNVSLNGWKKGDRCLYCSGLAKKDISFVRGVFEKEGYILLTNEYTNARTKLRCKCSVGHMYMVTWNNWQSGGRCPKCEDINFSMRFSGKNSWHWKNYSKEDLEKLSIYKSVVWRITNFNYEKHKSIVNPLCLPRGRNKYHLDHIYSIMDGFRNNVKPEIISHPANLQMLPEKINISKGSVSDRSLDELYDNYNKELN